MSHSLTKIWIHSIIGTKDSEPMIKNEIEPKIYGHIKNKLENELDCRLKTINGTNDHTHLLFLMSQSYSLKDIMQNIKGETSHWINQNNLSKFKFAFQIGYGAFSVSESMVSEVEKYIKSQKEHHKKLSFKEEYDLFMKKYGFGVETVKTVNN